MPLSRKLTIGLAAAAIAVVLVGGVVATQSGNPGRVTINGILILPYDAALIGLAPGDYWFDQLSGFYGLVGGPALGNVNYGPDVGGGGGYNFDTLFGGGMSDGSCAFILEVQVGNC